MTHTIRTERLLLRPPADGDAAVAARVLGDWDVVKETESWGYPVDEARTAWRFEQHAKLPLAEGVFFVMDADGHGVIGTIGLAQRVGTTFGLGYMIGKAFWGQGYVTEAARAACLFAFDTMGAERIEADVFQANPASSAVLRKVGFRFTGDPGPGWSATRGGNFPRYEYALTRKDLA